MDFWLILLEIKWIKLEGNRTIVLSTGVETKFSKLENHPMVGLQDYSMSLNCIICALKWGFGGCDSKVK